MLVSKLSVCLRSHGSGLARHVGGLRQGTLCKLARQYQRYTTNRLLRGQERQPDAKPVTAR